MSRSTLVHDGDNSCRGLIESLGLESEVHLTSETKGLRDNENPMDHINDGHEKLKRFLRSHGGYARLAKPVLVHMERAEEQIREGR